MKKFEFKGDWFTTIELRTFDKELDNPRYSFRRKELEKAEYQIELYDDYDFEPDLSEEQINAIEHLQEESNQMTILKNLYTYFKEIVYPHYQTFISEEEYPGTFPILNNQSNLKDVIGLDHIAVLRFGKDGSSYYNLMFETSLDEEHGIGFVLHNNSIIEHGEIGGIMYEKVASHMGMTNEEYSDYQTKIQTPPTKEYQIAHKKFGKLKPWQQDVNKSYHYFLYSSKQDYKLIEYIETGKITIQKAFEALKYLINKDDRIELIEYFNSKGYK